MTRGRIRQLALVSLAVLAVRVELAAPAFSTAELRAVSHCAAHRGRPVSTADAARCCAVGAPGDRDATMAAGAPLVAPGATLLAVLPSGLDGAPPADPLRPARAAPPRDTGPPRFLALRTLRN